MSYDNRNGQMGTLGSGGYAPTLRFNRDQATLAWDARFDFDSMETSLQQTTTETTGRLLPAGTVGAGAPRKLENRNHVLDTKLVTDIGNNKLSIGGQYLDAQLVDGVAASAFTFVQWALFAENQWSINDALNLSPRAYLVRSLPPTSRWLTRGNCSSTSPAPTASRKVGKSRALL